MLHLQAVFERKTNEFPVSDCVIENIVELTEAEYKHFRSSLLQDVDFITENKNRMYRDKNGINHCLLVLGENSAEGVLVQSEGYDYARYSSLVPGARDFVTARLNTVADQIIREGTHNTESGTWAVYFEELKEQYNICIDSANGIGTMLQGILEARPEMAEIEFMEDGYDMTFYLDYCPNLNENPASQEPEEPGMTMKI